jgi:ABC-type transport system involved in multi-copper enzyme maturation permease subunit
MSDSRSRFRRRSRSISESSWFSVVVLLAWGLVPVVVGYRRFDNADLG